MTAVDDGHADRRDAPIVIVDIRTGARQPYWAELDANATNPQRQALLIRPAKNFLEGRRYAVALRHVRDRSGKLIQPSATFERLVGDRLPHNDPLRDRQRALRRTLRDLAKAGISTRELHLAWDFAVASPRG